MLPRHSPLIHASRAASFACVEHCVPRRSLRGRVGPAAEACARRPGIGWRRGWRQLFSCLSHGLHPAPTARPRLRRHLLPQLQGPRPRSPQLRFGRRRGWVRRVTLPELVTVLRLQRQGASISASSRTTLRLTVGHYGCISTFDTVRRHTSPLGKVLSGARTRHLLPAGWLPL